MSTKIKFDFLSVINAIPSVVVVVDADRKIIGVNNFARRFFRKVDLTGKNCDEVFSGCERRGYGCPVEGLDCVTPFQMMKCRQRLRIGDHEEEVRCRIIPAELDAGGQERVFLHIVLDRDLLARERLIELEKNLTITTLTAGIAHEFNNMNAGIYGLVELVLSHEDLSEQTAQDMGTIMKIVKRANHLIDQLLIFANKKPSRHVLVKLETIVNDCIKILGPELAAHGIIVEFARKSPIEDMFLDVNKISLAIMNIMLNARDAMLESAERRIEIETGKEGGFCYVKIRDRGTGIPHEFLDRIFEPFYTTKGPVGHSRIPGTGLGLSVAAGVIREHSGSIEVDSEYGRGSTFTIKLPADSCKALDSALSREYLGFDFTGKRILVVDDEAELNNLLVRALASKNAEVSSAFTGAQSLAHLEREPVDLMLLDIQLPDLNGWDIVERLKYDESRPRVIVISGNYLVVNSAQAVFVEKVLLKPFDLQELYTSVREALETRR